MALRHPSGEHYVTWRPVAIALGFTVSDDNDNARVTVHRYCAKYGLPTHKVGGRRLFLMSEIHAWLISRCTSTAPDQAVS